MCIFVNVAYITNLFRRRQGNLMWMDIIIKLLQVTAFIGGLLIIYAGAFLYVDERDKLQNLLEDWFFKGKIRQKSTRKTLVNSFFSGCESSLKFLNRLYGAAPVSGKMLIMSFILSMFLVCFCLAVIAFIYGTDIISLLINVVFSIFVLLHVKMFYRRPEIEIPGLATTCLIGLLVIGSSTLSFSLLFDQSIYAMLIPLFVFWFTILLIPVSDIISINVTRYVLKLLSRHKSVILILLALLIDLFIALIFVGIPFFIFYQVPPNQNNPKVYFLIPFFANLTNLIPTLIYLSFSSVFMIHILIWNTFLRPVYQFTYLKVFHNQRGKLCSIGLALIAISIFPDFGRLKHLLQKLFEIVG